MNAPGTVPVALPQAGKGFLRGRQRVHLFNCTIQDGINIFYRPSCCSEMTFVIVVAVVVIADLELYLLIGLALNDVQVPSLFQRGTRLVDPEHQGLLHPTRQLAGGIEAGVAPVTHIRIITIHHP